MVLMEDGIEDDCWSLQRKVFDLISDCSILCEKKYCELLEGFLGVVVTDLMMSAELTMSG